MNIGSFLAGFGPGILDAQDRLSQQRERQQRNQLMMLETRQRMKQMQDEAEGTHGALDIMKMFGGGGGPAPSVGGTPALPPLAGNGPPPQPAAASAQPGDPAALVRKYESEGLAKKLGMSPYAIGVGGTDLSNAPLDATGFPQWSGQGNSHAAGAYQFQPGTWAPYASKLGVKDFSPESQDKVFQAAYKDQGMKPWAPYNPKIAQATSGAQAPASEGTDEQHAAQGTQAIAAQVPPDVRGKLSAEWLMGKIANAPGSDKAKMIMLEKLTPLLSPFWQQQMQMQMHDLTRREHEQDRSQDREWQVQTEGRGEARTGRERQATAAMDWHPYEDGDGTRFEYNPKTREARTFVGNEPYQIKDIRKVRPIGSGAATQQVGAAREADTEREISRRDREFEKANPGASQDEKDAAHFRHRQQAEHGMAEAKAAPARNMGGALARSYIEAHPDATPDDLIALAGKARREQSIQTAFAGGEGARQVRSLNTVADHVNLTREYAEALRNNDIPRANMVLNRWAIETGHPEVNDFNAARTIMADEIVRLLTSTGGTEQDRLGMQAMFSENASPEQAAGALNVATRFVGGRLSALRQQYARNDPTRQRQFDDEMLTPAARQMFSTPVPRATDPQRQQPAGPPAGGAQPAPGGGVIRYDAQGNRIP